MRSLIFACFLALAFGPAAYGADEYPAHPDSEAQEGVPKGEVTKYQFRSARHYPGTVRDYWVYVPKQYDPTKPGCVMVFQDGLQYKAPVVFDNLIRKKEIPVLIGIFVMHGRVEALDTNSALHRFNRSYEYDTVNDTYVRFLLEELFPDVESKTASDGRPIRLSKNGNDRAIAGNSSGAICAFTAAWERPEEFTRVFSAIGTYVGLRGGNDYPTLVRKTEPKSIRVFLQDGSNDLNIYGGNWWIANQDMLSALQFSGYEVNHIWGEGGHNGKHATAIFPDALRWLWKDWPEPVKAGVDSKQPFARLFAADSEWQAVSEGHKFTEGPVAGRNGELFFTDIPNNRIHKIDASGKVAVFAENTGAANGLTLGPDGRLYACANAKREIVAYAMDGKAETVARDVGSNDLAATQKGDIYFTDPGFKKVYFLPKGGQPRVADEGIGEPNGVILTPDQSLLIVSDTAGQFVYSFQVQPDGSLKHKQRYFHLHLVDGSTRSGADGMTVDTRGNLYVTTELGLQICDQAGRVNAIIPKPQRAWLSNVAFGGPNLDDLYVTCGDKVYKRKTTAKGVCSCDAPLKPDAPRL